LLIAGKLESLIRLYNTHHGTLHPNRELKHDHNAQKGLADLP
jgi:hypothetical protein